MPFVTRPRWIIGVAVTLLAAGVLSIWGHPASDYRHSDFFQFWAAPRLLLEGRDPYDASDWASIYAREAAPPVPTPPPPGRHVYPPWSAVPLLPLGALPFDVAASLWLAAQVAVVALTLRALARIFGHAPRERTLLFGLAAAFQPLWLIVGGGNVTGFLLGLNVLALDAVLAHPRVAGIALAALAVKPHPFVISASALIAIARARVTLVLAAALAAAVLVASTPPFGARLTSEWLTSALDLQGTAGSNATVWTLDRALPGGRALTVAVALASVVALVVWWRAARPVPAVAFAAAVAISLFVALHGWSYDQILLLIPLAAILSGVGRATGTRRIALLLVTAAVAVLLPWALYALAFTRGGEEWSAVTPLAFFALLAVTNATSSAAWRATTPAARTPKSAPAS